MKEVIIFGAGVSGQLALNFLGYHRIFAFADNYRAGEVICGKKVISYKEMLELSRQDMCIVVIASEKYFEEMEAQFLQDGGGRYFVFREAMINNIHTLYPGYWLYRKWLEVPFVKALSDLKINQYGKIAIYGYNEGLPYLILDILEMNPEAELEILLDNPEEGINTLRYPKTKFDVDVIAADCLLINVRTTESDIHNILDMERFSRGIKSFSFEILDLYSIEKFESAFRYEGLEEYKDKYKGKRAWIIATGPSLRIEDLEKLQEQGEFCIGVNKIIRAYDKTKWRADMLVVLDPTEAHDCEAQLSEEKCDVFVGDGYHVFTRYNIPSAKRIHFIEHPFLPNLPCFSEDIATKGVCRGNTVTYVALQLALYMGFNEIYLLGVDAFIANSTIDKNAHFIENYHTEKELERYQGENLKAEVKLRNETIYLSYEKAKQVAEAKGVKIYNATRGGRLEVFERVDFDSVVGKKNPWVS